jgi:hypothetical protein
VVKAEEKPRRHAQLARHVLECFVAVDTAPGATAIVGICALGYEGHRRIFDVRRGIEIADVGGALELAALRAALWAQDQWRDREAIVIHVSGEYMMRRLEAAVATHRGDGVLETFGVGPEIAIVVDRTDRPATPRMAEAASLVTAGARRLMLDL